MYTGQVAVVTGASGGIGAALAVRLAATGAKVGLVARRAAGLEQVAGAIRSVGGTAAWVAADAADSPALEAAVAKLSGDLGPVDLMIANAGVSRPTRLDPPNTADVELTVRVNFFGVVYAFAAVLPDMLRRGRGHLVAVSSLAGYRGLPGQPAYSASKAAVTTYCEGLRIRLRPRGIAVTTVCPGFVRTPMTADFKHPMPWLMDADAAARRIVRALPRRPKVYDFPRRTAFLVKLSRWLPDWLVYRAARENIEEAAGPVTGPPR